MPKTQTPGTEPRADDPPSAAADASESLAEAIHALRNGMNSLLMNTAVLGARIDEVPQSLRPFVEQISKAGYRCSEDLARLFALVDTQRR